jgi:hypothetical protein
VSRREGPAPTTGRFGPDGTGAGDRCNDRAMTDLWRTAPASEVRPGDRVRVAGKEFDVARIEAPFLGRAELIAFIEDTPARWFKQPVPASAELEIRVDSAS